MGELPLVSIVVPTFNRPEYLGAAIQSALDQTYDNVEVLVCDDASGPETTALVESFSDTRIRHLRSPTNQGVLRNTQQGYRAARGVYTATLHDDDAWGPDLLSTLVPELERDPELIVAFSDHYVMTSEGEVDMQLTQAATARFGRDRLSAGKHMPFHELALVDQAIPILMSAVIRREALDWDSIPEPSSRVYDLWLAYMVCRTGMGAYYSPERLMRYRAHEGSATAAGGLAFDSGIRWCWERFLEDPALAHLRPHFRRQLAIAESYEGIDLLLLGRRAAARRRLVSALRTQVGPRAIAGLALTLFPREVARRVTGRARA
jgi:glycosyltransferase involved in cell wall biosynthesis